MTQMLLDYIGDAPLHDGYILVASEVEFLQLSLSNNNIQVKGENLCKWAEAFCTGRSIHFRILESPILEIQDMCPGIEVENAEKIYKLIGQKNFDTLSRPITVSSILTAIYPLKLWIEDPSYVHAADWLLWLLEVKPPIFLRTLFLFKCEEWQANAFGLDKRVYSATDAETALITIQRWVGLIEDSSYQSLKGFPRPIPDTIQNDARKKWKHLLIETHGFYLRESLTVSLHPQIKAILVEEAYQYFKRRKQDITQEIFELLSPFLGWQEQKELQSLLPPEIISPMPRTSKEILEWFKNSYFPYRRWQYGNGDKHIQAEVDKYARDFGIWYLSSYPEAISSGNLKNLLSFSKIVETTRNSKNYVTLIVVLDGLHAGDAQTLVVKIKQKVLRLSIIEENLVFTALPTVTEFCKPALFAGVPPNVSDTVSPIGVIIPEKEDPLLRLNESHLGDVFLWRVQQPDSSYHEKGREALVLRKVEGELEKIVKDISEIVERVQTRYPLQIIITTDHGRLIDSSQRKVPTPEGMTSHGRAAWGKFDIDFGGNEFVIVENLAYIKGERYGMKYNFAVLLNGDTFLMSDGKSGKENFPHGGVYPEEVIIPWITFIRDHVAPEVKIKISGRSIAGSSGNMLVTISNYADIEISLTNLIVRFGDRTINFNELSFTVNAGATKDYNLEIEQWPTKFELRDSNFTAKIIQPNGFIFDSLVEVSLESDEMYDSTNILEELA